MMTKGTALWHLSAQQSALRTAPLVPSNFSFLKIQSLYSMVSSGTERLVAKGLVPRALNESMQVPGQEGNFNFPIKYGYSLVGKVINDDHPLSGKNVHLLHPHQDFCYVDPSRVAVIPEGIPPLRATLASNLETAINAVWDGGATVGDKILIVGFGIIGALVAEVLRNLPGVEIWVLEKKTSRIKMAKNLGWNTLEDTTVADFDLTFHTTGHQEGLQSCIDHLAFGGKVVELSWYGEKNIQLQLGGTFHSQRKQIISSQVGRLPLNKRDRWDFARRKALVFKLLQVTNYDRLITTLIPFADAPDFFNKLRDGIPEGLGVGIQY